MCGVTLPTIRHTARRALTGLRRITEPARRAALRRRTGLKLHLGCGDDRLEGFTNIDYRPTRATDVVMNLDAPRFAPGSIALAFSNAFFEHLYRASRATHLRAIRDALQPDGVCCYIGIPYFRNVARFYLDQAPGTAGDRFDLFNVYRYTHGAPEQADGWWIGQLHKSLFDEEELAGLLRGAGFESYVLFCYGYPGDAHELPVTMGFFATRAGHSRDALRRPCLAFLERFADVRIRLRTLEWLSAPTDTQ